MKKIRWIFLAKEPDCRGGSLQSSVLNQQFEAPTQEETQSRIRRLADRDGSQQSAVASREQISDYLHDADRGLPTED